MGPGKTLEQSFNPASNSFGFLRLLFAAFVVFAHTFAIGGFGPDLIFRLSSGQTDTGTIGVYCFFIISGFLVARSESMSPSLARFMWHRCLRIFPGFWACLALTGLVLAPILYYHEHGSWVGIREFFYSPVGGFGYIARNFFLRMHQYGIYHLLTQNPYPFVFNGSLWSLALEFACYVVLGLLGAVGITRRRPHVFPAMAALLWVGLIIVDIRAAILGSPNVYFQDFLLARVALYFSLGASAFLYGNRLKFSGAKRWASIALLGLGFAPHCFVVFAPLALAYLVFSAAFELPLVGWDRKWDLSYGTYLFAFPIQQTLFVYGGDQFGITFFFFITLVLALAAGWISFVLVEHPALRLKSMPWRPSPPIVPEAPGGNTEGRTHGVR